MTNPEKIAELQCNISLYMKRIQMTDMVLLTNAENTKDFF